MVIEIQYREIMRVFEEMNKETVWKLSRNQKTHRLGLKLLSDGRMIKEHFAVTDSTKFFLMAIKYGIQYTKLE